MSVPATVAALPAQGDALSGLALAVAGVGPASAGGLPAAAWPAFHDGDAWVATLSSETGWYVLLSHDNDIARAAASEPTVLIAPLVLVPTKDWEDLVRRGGSARRFPYPMAGFSGIPAGHGLVVDLAWTTNILKGSLASPEVSIIRLANLTTKNEFSAWTGARTSRGHVDPEVMTKVLNPFQHTRSRLLAALDKAPDIQSAPIESRVVAAAERWFAQCEHKSVTVLGQLTAAGIQRGKLADPQTNEIDVLELTLGQRRLTGAVRRRMTRVDPAATYSVTIILADLATISAEQFVAFALLIG